MSNMNDERRGALALANATPRTVGRVGIIGANTTGTGIAMNLLDADVPVTLFDLAREPLGQGMALVRSAYQGAVDQGRLTPDQRDRRMALLAGTVYFHHLKDCDLIIEAGSTADKERLFRGLDQVARPGAVLMAHAAAPGGVDRLARCTRRGGEVLGWQLPGPADAGGACEFVCGKDTSAQALATVIALAAIFNGVPAAA